MALAIRNGVFARDRITGFKGRVTGMVEYISGCNQALLAPPVDADGKIRESNWFDLQRLEVIPEEGFLQLDNDATPGCDAPPPKR